MRRLQNQLNRAKRLLVPPAPPPRTRPDGLYFYQACDLPGLGFVPGAWDHRGSEAVYLAHTDFAGKTVVDVGPGNGFWSFEMERRGGSVTAIELGSDDKWDAVPHAINHQENLATELRSGVELVHEQFWQCHAAHRSSVKVMRGTAYGTPALMPSVDIAMMGNILQHLRDPFLALERVASVVRERIIVSESLWIYDSHFLNSAQMQLIPRSHLPNVNHSWYQVSPVLVGEMLKILGFANLKCEMHEQIFNGNDPSTKPQMVRHFTYSGDRSNDYVPLG